MIPRKPSSRAAGRRRPGLNGDSTRGRVAGLLLAGVTAVAGCAPVATEELRGEHQASPPPAPTAASAPGRQWSKLAEDGIHDPQSPVIGMLQEPGEALQQLPATDSGNKVDWAQALRSGAITPRTNLDPGTEIEVLDLDILLPETSVLPMVLFPHRHHTEWLACENCHDKIFKAKAGATEFGMYDILQGKFCGRCHGAVSFPLIECERCHSVPRR